MVFWHTAIVCLLATNGLLIAVQQPVKKVSIRCVEIFGFFALYRSYVLIILLLLFLFSFFLLFIRSSSVLNFFWLCARVRRSQQFLVGFFLAQPKQLDDFIKGITINSQ